MPDPGEAPYCEEGIEPEGQEDSAGQDNSGDGIGGVDDDMPIVTLTADIRQQLDPLGARVLVEDLVVTARPTRDEYYLEEGYWDVFVQDQGGGPWSGLRLQTTSAFAGVLDVGDTVDVVGVVSELSGVYFVQVRPWATDLVEVTGSAEPPSPPVISTEDLTIDNADAYPYEAMPVRIEQAIVTDDDACLGEFVLDGTVRVDDRFAPGTLLPVTDGTMLDDVGGVLIYTFDAFELAPRDANDLPGD